MQDLKFLGLRNKGQTFNTTNRDWSTSEEADISCYSAPNVGVECWEDTALVTRNEETTEFDVYVTAIADNVYIASQAANGRIYATDSLRDCLDTAALMVWRD